MTGLTEDFMNNIKAIETIWAGRKFRSRIEARWAVFFQEIGAKWHYEFEGFEFGPHRYLPDFWIENVNLRTTKKGPGLLVEIKPVYPEENYIKKLELFSESIETPLALLVGDVSYGGSGHPNDGHFQFLGQKEVLLDGPFSFCWYDNFMAFWKCPDCGSLKFEFTESNYDKCDSCEFSGYGGFEHDDILDGVFIANTKRFEF